MTAFRKNNSTSIQRWVMALIWTNLITYLLLSTFVEFIILFAQGLSLTPLCPSDSIQLVSTNYSDIQESIIQLNPQICQN
jgi:hypothetical protein